MTHDVLKGFHSSVINAMSLPQVSNSMSFVLSLTVISTMSHTINLTFPSDHISVFLDIVLTWHQPFTNGAVQNVEFDQSMKMVHLL